MCHALRKPMGSLSFPDGDGKGIDGKEEGTGSEEGEKETGWCVK